jgi:hypothetical protein
MGTDVHVVLGRIKPEACRLQITQGGVTELLVPKPENLTPQAIDAFCPPMSDPPAFLSTVPLNPEDYEFLEIDDEAPAINGNPQFEVDRDYKLFDWLSNYGRSDLRPHVGWRQHQADAQALGEFMNTGKPTYLDMSYNEEFTPGESFTDRYYLGWGGITLIPLSWLMAYDYDQIAEIIDKHESYTDGDGVYHDLDTYKPDPEGKTYRHWLDEKGTNNFFRLIEVAKEGQWDFIIFTYGG